jgi:hypothetical protein
MNVYENSECSWNVQKRNIFQNVLKHSQKINVNVQNSNNEFIFKLDEDFCSKDKHSCDGLKKFKDKLQYCKRFFALKYKIFY